MNPKPAPRKERASFIQNRRAHTGMSPRVLYSTVHSGTVPVVYEA